MEAARKRRIEEQERRNLQQRTTKSQKVNAEKKVMARQTAKDFLFLFKRDSLKIMTDEGLLRKPRDFSIHSTFIPQLYGQIQFDIQSIAEHTDNLDSLLNFCMRAQSRTHREAMIKEYKRREENKKEAQRLQREKEEQKRVRKEQRAALRERHRIGLLMERVQTNTLATAVYEEFTPAAVKVYDIRDPEAKKDGIIVIGGLIGEIIVTFTCLLDYILANPQNANFQFTPETVEAFLKDLLITEGFQEGAISLGLASHPVAGADPSSDFSGVDEEGLARFAKQRDNISNHGLGFLFDVMRDLVISQDFVDIIYAVIAKIVKTQPKETLPIPEIPGPDADGNEPSEDDRAAIQKKIEEITKTNQDIDRFNDDLQKMQAKVKLVVRPNSPEIVEVGIMRLHNQRDQQLNESSINASQDHIRPSLGGDQKLPSAREGNVSPDGANAADTSIISLDNFSLEDLPLKAILVDPKAAEDTHLIVYHSGKSFVQT